MNKILLLLSLLPIIAGANPRTITADILESSDLTQSYTINYATLNNIQTTLTFTAPLVNTLGVLTCNVASGSMAGCLASADFATFAATSAAAITSLTGDVVASGPGAVNALIPTMSYQRWVNFVTGNDGTGTGSQLRPWKTIQKACTAVTGLATINTPVTINLDGGNNDFEAGPISCPPNIALNSGYSIQIPVAFVISGGSTNDNFWASNIEFIGAFTWSRNDATDMSATFSQVAFGGATTLKQAGSGGLALEVYNSSFDAATEIQAPTFGSIFYSTEFNAATTFDDVTSAAYYEFLGGYMGAPISIAGGPFIYFSGIQADVPFGYTLTMVTTGNGSPTLQTDSGSVPPTITGTPTLILTSYAQHESYTPAVPGNWSPAPGQVAAALDQLAARGSGSGSVTSVSVVGANGFAGTVATSTTTPAITLSTTVTGLLKGNGTSISAAVAGTDYVAPFTYTQEVPSGSINNSNVTFTLAHTPQSNAGVVLFGDNGPLVQGTDYIIASATITMAVAPNFGQTLYATYQY